MNPFDWYGPQFLLFYAVFTAAVLAVLYSARLLSETEPESVRLRDPYLIAYLRGGDIEAVRIVCLALMDRGILRFVKHVDSTALAPVPEKAASVGQPLEQQILRVFGSEKGPEKPLDKAIAEARECPALLAFEKQLQAQGLIPGSSFEGLPFFRFCLGVALLLGVSFVKGGIGLSRHRPVSFLLILTVFAIVLAYKVCFHPRPSAFQKVMEDLRNLFDAARRRAGAFRPGKNTGELVAIAAIYGLAEIPDTIPYAHDIDQLVASQYAAGGGVTASLWSTGLPDWMPDWDIGGGDGGDGGSSGGSSCGGGCGGGCGGCGS